MVTIQLAQKARRDLGKPTGEPLHLQQLGARVIGIEPAGDLLVVIVAADRVARLAKPGDQLREGHARRAGHRPAPPRKPVGVELVAADTDELLLLARKIPDAIRERVIQRPDAFLRLAGLDDTSLDRVLSYLDS